MRDPVDSRFAVTALDYKLKDYAIKDELLINKDTGELYYSRKKDGKIIPISGVGGGGSNSSLSNNAAYKDSVINIMQNITLDDVGDITSGGANMGGGFIFTVFDMKDMNGDTLEIAPTVDCVDMAFNIHPLSKGFFININSTDLDIPLIDMLTYLYNTKNGMDLVENAVFDYSVTITGTVSGNPLVRTYTEQARAIINDYTRIMINPYVASQFSSISKIQVTITSMGFPELASVYTKDLLTEDPYKAVSNDGMVQIKNITVGYFIESMDTVVPVEGMTIVHLTDIKTMLENISEGQGQKVIVSKEKPLVPCIWFQVTKSKKVYEEGDEVERALDEGHIASSDGTILRTATYNASSDYSADIEGLLYTLTNINGSDIDGNTVSIMT